MINPDLFLFIEPENKNPVSLNDDITKFFKTPFDNMISRNDFTKGWHTCACGKKSDNVTYHITLNGKEYITNKLALHYVEMHRDEIPEKDLQIIQEAFLANQSNNK